MFQFQLRKPKKVMKKKGRIQVILYQDYKRFLTLGFLQRAGLFRVYGSKVYHICLLSINIGLFGYWYNYGVKVPLWLNNLLPILMIDGILQYRIYMFYLNKFKCLIRKFYGNKN